MMSTKYSTWNGIRPTYFLPPTMSDKIFANMCAIQFQNSFMRAINESDEDRDSKRENGEPLMWYGLLIVVIKIGHLHWHSNSI